MIKFKNNEIYEKVSNITPLMKKLSTTKDYDLALAGLIEYNRVIDFILEYIFELEQYIEIGDMEQLSDMISKISLADLIVKSIN